MTAFHATRVNNARLWAESSAVARGLLVVLLAAVWAIHLLAGAHYSFSLFYLIPISAGAYLFGLRFGVVLAALATGAWLMVDSRSLEVFSSRTVPLVNEFFRMVVFVAVAAILARLRASVDREKNLAMTDFLTGIPNRRAFFQLAERELNRARREQQVLSLAVLDVDDFQQVNENRGHDVGDVLLCAVGEILLEHVRSTDIVARLGGDEFSVLMPGADAGVARHVLARLLRALEIGLEKRDLPATFTVGLVTTPCVPSRVDELLRSADSLLVQGKKQGKNTIEQRALC